MENITIRMKLILSTILSIVGLGILVFLLNLSIHDLSELKDAQTKVEELKSDMLMLRRNEKDFLLRKDMKDTLNKYLIDFDKEWGKGK